jgi:hypothetical protein
MVHSRSETDIFIRQDAVKKIFMEKINTKLKQFHIEKHTCCEASFKLHNHILLLHKSNSDRCIHDYRRERSDEDISENLRYIDNQLIHLEEALKISKKFCGLEKFIIPCTAVYVRYLHDHVLSKEEISNIRKNNTKYLEILRNKIPKNETEYIKGFTHWNVEFFESVLTECNYIDKDVCKSLRYGFELFGDIQSGNLFKSVDDFRTKATKKKKTDFDLGPPKLSASHCERAWAFLEKMSSTKNYSIISDAVKNDIANEVAGHRAIGPFKVESPEEIINLEQRIDFPFKNQNWFVSPRFGLVQSDKIRSVDHYSYGRDCINTRTITRHKVSLPSLNHFAYCVSTKENSKRFFKIDSENAYRQLPLKPDQVPYGGILFKQEDGFVIIFPTACPFGAVSSVSSYLRLSSAITFFQRCVMLILCANYLDDFFGEEDSEESEAFDSSLFCHKVIGNKIKPKKIVPPNTKTEILGIIVSKDKNCLKLSVKQERICQLIESLEAPKTNPNLINDKLCGKLSFALSVTRINSKSSLRHLYRLCRNLETFNEITLFHIDNILENFRSHEPKRELNISLLTDPKTWSLIYTDAAKENDTCSVGGCLFDGSIESSKHYSSIVKSKMGTNWHINHLELLSVLIGVETFEVNDSNVILFCDNTTAEGIIRNGSSKNKDLNMLVCKLWRSCARRNINVYVSRVKSKANIADLPSRFLQLPFNSIKLNCKINKDLTKEICLVN